MLAPLFAARLIIADSGLRIYDRARQHSDVKNALKAISDHVTLTLSPKEGATPSHGQAHRLDQLKVGIAVNVNGQLENFEYSPFEDVALPKLEKKRLEGMQTFISRQRLISLTEQVRNLFNDLLVEQFKDPLFTYLGVSGITNDLDVFNRVSQNYRAWRAALPEVQAVSVFTRFMFKLIDGLPKKQAKEEAVQERAQELAPTISFSKTRAYNELERALEKKTDRDLERLKDSYRLYRKFLIFKNERF